MLVSGSSSASDASYQWFGPPSAFQMPFLVPSCRLPVAFLLASCCFLQPSAGLPPAVLPAAFQPSCGLPTPAFLHASGRGVHACFRGASIGHEVCFRTAFHGRKASFQTASCVLSGSTVCLPTPTQGSFLGPSSSLQPPSEEILLPVNTSCSLPVAFRASCSLPASVLPATLRASGVCCLPATLRASFPAAFQFPSCRSRGF